MSWQNEMASKLPLWLSVLLVLAGCVSNSAYHSLDGPPRSPAKTSQSAPPVEASQSDKEVTPSLLSPRPGHYRVRRGDTLYSIAFRYGLDYKKLANANRIGPDFTIFVGQELVLREAERGPATNRPQPAKPEPAPRPAAPTAIKDTKVNSQNDDVKRLSSSASVVSQITWTWPHDGKIVRTFNADVSDRKGVDISGDIGDSVMAAASGRVVYAGNGLPGYGNLIILEHSSTLLSAYAFNQELLVSESDRVERGQVIARLGKQGDQPRLHFEIRREGKPVDPMGYLPRR